jgi:HAMP domain-containing protein
MTFGLYLLLNIVIILFFALWIRRLVTRRLSPERVLADLRDEIGTLITELNQTGDHNISILEDRIRDLRELLAAADRQIDDLSSMIAVARETADKAPGTERTGAGGPATQSKGSADSAVGWMTDATDPADPVYRVDFGRTGAGAAGTSGGTEGARAEVEGSVGRSKEAALAAEERLAETAEPVLDPALSPPEQVRELHLQGVSPELIASRTGMAIGEIELIISLGARKGRR